MQLVGYEQHAADGAGRRRCHQQLPTSASSSVHRKRFSCHRMFRKQNLATANMRCRPCFTRLKTWSHSCANMHLHLSAAQLGVAADVVPFAGWCFAPSALQ